MDTYIIHKPKENAYRPMLRYVLQHYSQRPDKLLLDKMSFFC